MLNLRNTTDEHMGREGKIRQKQRGRQTIRDTKTEQTEGCQRGGKVGACAKWVMGIKEGARWDDQWVFYGSGESLGSTLKTNTALYVN